MQCTIRPKSHIIYYCARNSLYLLSPCTWHAYKWSTANCHMKHQVTTWCWSAPFQENLLFVVTSPKPLPCIILLQSPQGGICLDQFHNVLFIWEFNQISPPPISPNPCFSLPSLTSLPIISVIVRVTCNSRLSAKWITGSQVNKTLGWL